MELHPAVQKDFNAAVEYYEAEGGTHLADRFEEEVRSCIAAIKAGYRAMRQSRHVARQAIRIPSRTAGPAVVSRATSKRSDVVARLGIEPRTRGFSVLCSTN